MIAKQDCISQGIFVDYLNRKEFCDMAKDEFTMDNFIALKEQEAREEGAYKKSITMVINLYNNNVPIDIIASSAEITEKEVLAIIKQYRDR